MFEDLFGYGEYAFELVLVQASRPHQQLNGSQHIDTAVFVEVADNGGKFAGLAEFLDEDFADLEEDGYEFKGHGGNGLFLFLVIEEEIELGDEMVIDHVGDFAGGGGEDGGVV